MSRATNSLPGNLAFRKLVSVTLERLENLSYLTASWQIRGATTRNIVLYGLEATGKSSITKALLAELSQPTEVEGDDAQGHSRYAIIKSAECITGRQLFDQTVGEVAKALEWKGKLGRPENLAQLVVELEKLFAGWVTLDGTQDADKRLVLVFDGIDRQREAPATLLPALARLGEVIPNITALFIITSPPANFLHSPGAPHIHFPPYNKDSLVKILSLTTPTPTLPDPKETKETWSRFCGITWDSLSKYSGRDILSMRALCLRLWPSFILPIQSGTHLASQFHKLVIHTRPMFQAEGILVSNVIAGVSAVTVPTAKSQGIAAQLPYYSRLLLVAAYLASFNPPRTDSLYFMKSAAAKRRKKGGGTALSRPGVSKHRKISRKLLGAQAFVIERLLAIFHTIAEDADDRGRRGKASREVVGAADIQMAIATLASLRLLVKMGPSNAGDALDGGCKYRVSVGWDVVRGVARSVGLEADDYLAE